jgi:hypothetical protein
MSKRTVATEGFGIVYIVENGQQFWSGMWSSHAAIPLCFAGSPLLMYSSMCMCNDWPFMQNSKTCYGCHPSLHYPYSTRPWNVSLRSVLPTMVRWFSRVCSRIVNLATEQYLQTQLQVEHACELVLDSELFVWHSVRMTDILLRDAVTASACTTHCILFSHDFLEHGSSPSADYRIYSTCSR